MQDSPREEGSPRESIEIDKKRLYAYNTYNAYNNNSEKRVNHCIRYKPSTHKAVKEYCGGRITIGQFYEESAVLFMQVNPIDRVIVNIEKPERGEPCLDDQIEEVILIDELEESMKHLKPERKLHLVKKKRLAKLLKRCQKLNQRGERLEELMKKAVSYLV